MRGRIVKDCLAKLTLVLQAIPSSTPSSDALLERKGSEQTFGYVTGKGKMAAKKNEE